MSVDLIKRFSGGCYYNSKIILAYTLRPDILENCWQRDFQLVLHGFLQGFVIFNTCNQVVWFVLISCHFMKSVSASCSMLVQWCAIEMLRQYISIIEMRSLWTESKCIKSATRLLDIDCVNIEGLDLSKEVL